MNKKIIVMSAALVVIVLLTAFVMSLGKAGENGVPLKISVYDSAAGAIYTPAYDDFLVGCVNGLITQGERIEPEALKALAIAEDSRLRYIMQTRRGFEYLGADLTINEQAPYTSNASAEIREAVKSALNLSLTYDGEPFNAPICKVSAGKTEECPPYSPSLELPCDLNAKGFSSSASFTPEKVRAALGGGNLSYNFGEWFHDAVYSDNGTLLFIDLGDMRMTGDTLRRSLSLRSTAIDVEFAEDRFVFKCTGWGDNRGMSINAANFMAKQGKTAAEILEFFYPGAELS